MTHACIHSFIHSLTHSPIHEQSNKVAWRDKEQVAFWRGGSQRRFGGRTRKRLLECPAEVTPALKKRLDVHDAMRLAAVKRNLTSSTTTSSTTSGSSSSSSSSNGKPRECKTACQEWVGPMRMCRSKYPVFAQGEGYTSSKQRVLGCGSLPLFLEHDGMDSYFGRWLVENKHYKVISLRSFVHSLVLFAGFRWSVRSLWFVLSVSVGALSKGNNLCAKRHMNEQYQALRPESVCDDLKRVVWWAVEHDEMAQRIGVNARRFATRILGEHMVHMYLLAMLQVSQCTPRVHVMPCRFCPCTRLDLIFVR